MNKKTKRVVYKILTENEYARIDDWYLIQKVLIEMLDCNAGTAFGQVLQGMKYNGISFESITRARRKFLEERPELKNENISKKREIEEEKYYLEYSKHIPKID